MAAELTERQRRRFEKMTVKLQGKGILEPDEKVLNMLNNLTVPAWVFMLVGGGLLLLPYQLQKSSYVVLTDKHVYVIKGIGSKILLKARLGEVNATIEGSGFPGRCLVVGDQKIWLPINRKLRERGYAIAAAASAERAAAGAAASAAATVAATETDTSAG